MLISNSYLGSKKIIKSYLGSKLIKSNNNSNSFVVPDGWIDIREGMKDGVPQVNMLFAKYNSPLISLDVRGNNENSVIEIDWGDGKKETYTGNVLTKIFHDYSNSATNNLALFDDKECEQYKIQVTGDIYTVGVARTSSENGGSSTYQHSQIAWIEADCTGMIGSPSNNVGSMYTNELQQPVLKIVRLRNTQSITIFGQIARKATKLEVLDFNFGRGREVSFKLNGVIDAPCLKTFNHNCSMCSQFVSLNGCKNLISSNLGYIDNIKKLVIINNTQLSEFKFEFEKDTIALSFDYNLSSNNFDSNMLNQIMTNLPSAGNTNCKLNISGNPGVDTCDITIAESKGWNVVYS